MADRALDVASDIGTFQFTVTTTPQQVVPFRAGRKTLIITQVGSTAVYYGPRVQPVGNPNAGAPLSASNGALLPSVTNAGLTLFPFDGELYLVTASGTEVVTVTELL